MTSISIYVADDHPVYRRGLRRVIDGDTDLEFVGQSDNGEQALADIDEIRPDVAIIDISMPKKTGIEVLKETVSTETKIILLTGSEADDVIYAAMAAGASGYILKTADWVDLVAAVKKCHGGEPAYSPEIMTILSMAQQQAPRVDLTPRELEIISLVAEGLTSAETALKLGVEASTVKTHLRNLYAKLNVRSAAGAVAEALRRGLIK